MVSYFPGPGTLFSMIKNLLLNSKKRTDFFGLNNVDPVPLCFDTKYFPLGERD